ncbi:MAG: hypothetical protein ACRDXD_07090 [Acidimicrobiia bacterium]
MADRPNLPDIRRNWHHHPGPLRNKVRLTARNTLRRLTTTSMCCGHPGEPGC